MAEADRRAAPVAVLYRSWPPIEAHGGHAVIDRHGLHIERLEGLPQVLASGALRPAAALVGAAPPGLGLFEDGGQPGVAVRVARDRLLLVGPAAAGLAHGWHAEGFALTPIDDGLAVYELSGVAVPKLLRAGTAIDPGATSPCAALLFGGFAAIAYRCQGRWRLHIERGLAAAFESWLRQASEELP